MSGWLVKDACDGNMENFVARDTTKKGEINGTHKISKSSMIMKYFLIKNLISNCNY
jgi:hypothetical protein